MACRACTGRNGAAMAPEQSAKTAAIRHNRCLQLECMHSEGVQRRTLEASRGDQQSQIGQHTIADAAASFVGVLVVADARFDFGDNLRRVASHQLLDAGPKLMDEIHAGVIANVRTKVAERIRNRASPIRAVGRVNNG